MSDAATEPKKPGLFRRIITWPWRISLAARVAWATFLFLLALVAATWIVFFSSATSIPWWQSMSPLRILLIVVLAGVIPVVIYYGLRLWLEGEKSQFPEVDYAWNAGLKELADRGISIHSTPVFLVVGSAGEQHERDLLSAAGLSLGVEQIPKGPAPLHWYANSEAIFLFCSQTSWLSGQSAIKEQHLLDSGGSSFPLVDHSLMPAPPTAQPMATAPRPAAPRSAPVSGGSGSSRGTIMLDQFVGQEPPAAASAADSAAEGGGPAHRGTLVLPSPVERPEAAAAPVIAGGAGRRTPSMTTKVAQLPAHESAERLQQLAYVCQLLRRVRAPVCPINGILALIPFALVQSSAREVEETERAVKSDLLAIQRELQLRCPVTTLIYGMEREPGFRELVRRVGREPASTQRFGKGYDLRCQATPQEMSSISAHVCGAFEDWVYTLFRERGALTRPGNTRLYGLLCKVRCTLKTRLAEVLGRGFGFDKQQTPNDDPFLFSGCYFSATGETPDRQAFVRGVIDKLIDEQEQVEWTQQALEDEQRYQRWALTGIIVSGLLLVSLVGIVVYNRLS